MAARVKISVFKLFEALCDGCHNVDPGKQGW